MNELPEFPTDPITIDLVLEACRPHPQGGGLTRSSVQDLCKMYAELAGSDTTAVEEDIAIKADGTVFPVKYMRDAVYHPNDLLYSVALELKRLRDALTSEPH